MMNSIFALIFLGITILSIIEFRVYLKEYVHFRKIGLRKRAKVVSCFVGKSGSLPIKAIIVKLPVVEVDNDGEKIRLKTFQNQYSPLATFALYDSEVSVLIDPQNEEYCMIDWKAPIVVGIIFNIMFLVAFIHCTGVFT